MRSPCSKRDDCLIISPVTARSTDLSELTFLVSLLVPNFPLPIFASDKLTSHRSEPCSIFTSETSRPRKISRSAAT
ncbi:unannotated protein [freshwater metagenome]|uniref:Unannotated protein n=1 Tax=freshwater metagenome TaxID=449393 RepID=A0A6J7DFD7_9ZZZZ